MKLTAGMSLTLVAALLLGASTAQSQLGGILGKAKDAADKAKKSKDNAGKSKPDDATDADKSKPDGTKDTDKPKQDDTADASKSGQSGVKDADNLPINWDNMSAEEKTAWNSKPEEEKARILRRMWDVPERFNPSSLSPADKARFAKRLGIAGDPDEAFQSMSPEDRGRVRRRMQGLPDKTVESEQLYILDMQADGRATEEGSKRYQGRNAEYRRLAVEEQLPLKFTADDAAVKAYLAENRDTWDVMTAFMHDMVQRLHYTGEGTYLKQGLRKVKEVHFTTTPLQRDANNKGSSPFLFAFNAGTGVLSVARSTAYPGRLGVVYTGADQDPDSCVTYWVLEHMTSAPSYRKTYRMAESSGTWTCAWCHRQVQSKMSPKASGCPASQSGLHSWSSLK